jgi:hypothetical protein
LVRSDAIRSALTLFERALRCNVTGRLPSKGKPHSDLAAARPSARLSAVRAVTPRPPSNAADRPSMLGLLGEGNFSGFGQSEAASAFAEEPVCRDQSADRLRLGRFAVGGWLRTIRSP